jgi:sporulation protein YlmC with PRC-barrel domain
MGATQMGSAAEISTFIAADRVQGAAIYNTTGDKLGLIDDIVINKKTGDIAYAIISSGGFLGLGSRYPPLPWSMLNYDSNLDGYVVPVEPAQLEITPAYGRWI